MSTIITVHGTNASGPEEGERWWQKGSVFERHIREMVESENGELSFQPYVWDGANSEVSRRKAGEALFNHITNLETTTEPYVMVGHSHGGSVIATSLMSAAKHDNPLANLKSWLTIGTPFISMRKRLSLFSRLSNSRKTIYVSLATLSILIFAIMANGFFMDALSDKNTRDSLFKLAIAVPGFIALSSVPFFFVFLAFLYIDDAKRYIYKEKNRDFFIDKFASRYVALNHRDDEAVQGLTSLKSFEFEIFPKTFIVPFLSLLAVFFLPLVVLVLPFSETTTQYINSISGFDDQAAISMSAEIPRQGGSEVNLVEKTIASAGKYIVNIVDKLAVFVRNCGTLLFIPFASVMDKFDKVNLEGIQIALVLAAIPFASFICFVGIVFLSKGISRFLSQRLNNLTWRQIRQTAYGNDTDGEFAEGAGVCPVWMDDTSRKPIHDDLGKEISAYSDAAAAKAISKFRKGIRQFAFTKSERDKSDMFSDYLTWDELIHTAYFDIPRFRKLVAFTITQTEGFRATEAFKADPDFATVALWYDAMQMGHTEA